MRFGRHRHRWEDNIKIDITEILNESVKCFLVAEDRFQCRTFVNIVVNTWVILEHRILCLAGCLLTTVKFAISGNSGDQRAAGYFSFPGIRTLWLMCMLVDLAAWRTDLITEFATWYPVTFSPPHFLLPFDHNSHNKTPIFNYWINGIFAACCRYMEHCNVKAR